jgi:hypothetical protein
MKIDKVNGDVGFNEELHLYVNVKDPKIKYISVTTLVGLYFEPFDEDFWSGYKALEALMGEDFRMVKSELLSKKKLVIKISDFVNFEEYLDKKKEILASYSKKRIESAEYGTKIHKQKEESFYQGGPISLKDCGFTVFDGVFDCERHNFDLNRERAVLPEYLVYYSDPEGHVHIAGQMDLLIKEGNEISIYDYKTMEDGIESKAYYNKVKKQTKKMYYPINNLDDHKLMHYTLQLSIYAWMLQKINPNLTVKKLCLIHIDRTGKETEIEVPYKKEEVSRMIKDLRKQNQIKQLKSGKS